MENIYLATQGELTYKRPLLKREPENAAKSRKYCRFHEVHGHNTNECQHLRDLIEDYIRKKKLERYVQQGRNPPHNPEGQGAPPRRNNQDGTSEDLPNQERIIIHTISGGPHLADRSWAEMRRYGMSLKGEEGYVHTVTEERPTKRRERVNISFNDEDLVGRQYPHVDPMVITARIGPAEVFRILVDTGSSVNILFKHAFNKMKLSMKDVNPCDKPLHGFNGEATIPLGMVDLFVEIGSHPKSAVRLPTHSLL